MLAVITVQGCQLLNVPPAEGPIGATPIEATPPAVPGYPALHTVPPRPQLSYPVEQRRTIAEALISDRENARYTSQLVRHRSGLTELPPPPRPDVPAAEAAESIVPAPQPRMPATTLPPPPALQDRTVTDDERRALSEAATELDEGSLSDFIREMVRDTGPPEDAQPIIVPGPPASSEPAAAAPAPTAQAEPESAASGLFGWLRDLFAGGGADAADAAPPDQPAPAPDEADEVPIAPPAQSAPAAPVPAAPAPVPDARPDLPGAVAAVAPAPDAPRPGPARAQLERLIEPPPPAPGRSAPAAE